MNSTSIFIMVMVMVFFPTKIIAHDDHWTDTPDVIRQVKRIEKKLTSYRQLVSSFRGTIVSCEKMSWGSELSSFKENAGCDNFEESIHLYCIIFVGIVLIISIFYLHIKNPELYLLEYEDIQLSYDSRNVDPYIV